mgnify:FL=1
MSVPTILENRLSSLRDSVVQKAKGGEKEMESEWEKLEKLSKDELIIELVRSRWQLKNLQKVILELSQTMGSDCAYEPGQKPTDAWASKIADYANRQGSLDLLDWGVDEDTSYRYCNGRFDDHSEE